MNEKEIRDLEQKLKSLTERFKVVNVEYQQLQWDINTIKSKISGLKADLWEQKAKSLIGKYIKWENNKYHYHFFHILRSSKSEIIGEIVSQYYYISDGNKKLSEIKYQPHCWMYLTNIAKCDDIERLEENYKEITEEEFNLRKTTPLHFTKDKEL